MSGKIKIMLNNSNRLDKLAILVIFFYLLCSNTNNPGYKINTSYSLPESTIYKYWSYLEQRDYKNALRCFKNHDDKYYDSTLIYPISPLIESLTVDSIISKKYLNKQTCEIYYIVKFYSHKDKIWKSFLTGDILQWTNNEWKIDKVLTH